MKDKAKWIVISVVLAGLGLLLFSTAVAGPPAGELEAPVGAPAQATVGTSFTYQGQLTTGGGPVNDTCSMAFRLYDQSTDGNQVGSPITTSVPISDSLFTVDLDFGGSAFDGEARWLEVRVSCPGDSGYEDLGRQELTAAPYALYALAAPWDGLADVPAGFADDTDGVEYQNVIVVAMSGGDYSSVQAAIDSVTDAAADNSYLVWVAPGVYVEQVSMQPYVHLQGAGQEATVISSTASSSVFPPTQATLVLTRNVGLRDLTVGNSGTGTRNVALLATAGTTQTLVAGVTARAQGGGTLNYAVYLTGSGTGVTLQDVTALAENGSYRNYGLVNSGGAAATLRGGSFTGRGGTNALGIKNDGSGTTLQAESVTVLAENGSYNIGLANFATADATPGALILGYDAQGYPQAGGQDSRRPGHRADRHDCPGRNRFARALSCISRPQEKASAGYVATDGRGVH